MTLQTSEDPWRGIQDVPRPNYYPSRRVDDCHNPNGRNLHWALSQDGEPAFMVGYSQDENADKAMPKFRGIKVGEDRKHHLLILILQDADMRTAFLKVCEDIIAVLQTAPLAQQRKAFVLRLERWSYFFKGNHSALGLEEQKGLIAELQALRKIAIHCCSPREALSAWKGPERGVRDFAFGQTSMEVKSNRGSATPRITVNSATQLSVNPSERLFLYVVEVNQAIYSKGMSLDQYVASTRNVFDSGIDALEFETKLAAVGYRSSDDYSNTLWSIGRTRCFSVTESFPHIDETSLDPAITNITYDININHCNAFAIDEDLLFQILGAAHV